jgi:hypothetical protein
MTKQAIDKWTDNTTKLKISVHTLADMEEDIKLYFRLILEDYCKRHGVTNKYPKARINISFVVTPTRVQIDSCSWSDEEELMQIQFWDVLASTHTQEVYTQTKFFEIIAHEFTHASQFLTERKLPSTKGFSGKNSGLYVTSYNNAPNNDEYMFAPHEVEARVMEMHYYTKFGYLFDTIDQHEIALQTNS